MEETSPPGPPLPPPFVSPPAGAAPPAGGAPPVGTALAERATGTHRGLAELDPWQPERHWSAGGALHAVWPWGLGGVTETLEIIGLALLMFVVVRAGAQNFVVDGSSMVPTFEDGQLVIVNKLAYRSFDVSWLPWTDNVDWYPFGGEPSAGDVVVFRFPQNQERDFIKRIIAEAGQTVEVRDGQVLLDGLVVEEPYLRQAPRYRFGPETVPEGQLFVLGDNRNNSYDSHQWGMLDADLVIGRAELRYWPLGDAGRIGHARPVPAAGALPAEVSRSP